jgi:hypothetical protein
MIDDIVQGLLLIKKTNNTKFAVDADSEVIYAVPADHMPEEDKHLMFKFNWQWNVEFECFEYKVR